MTAFEEEKKRYAKQIAEGLTTIRKSDHFVVCSEVRGSFRANQIPKGVADAIPRRLKEIYRIGYHQHPAEFFTQYRGLTGGKNKLREATTVLTPVLISNSLGQAYPGLSHVAREVVDNFLKPPTRWGIINSAYAICPPVNPETVNGWKALEEKLPANETRVALKDVLHALLNPPYGYDFNTLTLLLASWLGFHRLNISLTDGRKTSVSIKDLAGGVTGKTRSNPKEFLDKLQQLSVSRVDRARDLERVRRIVSQVEEGGFERENAVASLETLRTIKEGDHISDSSLFGNVEIAIDKLEKGLIEQNTYDKEAAKIEEITERSYAIEDLVKQLKSIQHLNAPAVVTATCMNPADLRKALIRSIFRITQDKSNKLCKLAALTDYGKNETALKNMARLLAKEELEEAHELVQSALKKLASEKDRIRALEDAQNIIKIIENLSASGSLSELRLNHAKLKEYTQHPGEGVLEVALKQLIKVSGKIEIFEDFVENLTPRVEKINSSLNAQKIEKEILSEQNQYLHTEHFSLLEESLKYCEELCGFFKELEKPLPLTPVDLVRSIDSLNVLYVKLDADLSEAQRELATTKEHQLKKYQIEKEDEAIGWLEKIRTLLQEGGDLTIIENEIASPPIFLPETKLIDLDELKKTFRTMSDARAQEESLLRAIQKISTSGKLVDLRLAFKEIVHYLPGTPLIEEKVTEKKNSLENAVANLSEQVESWASELTQLKNSQAVNTFRDKIQRVITLYEDTELYGIVELQIKRCSVISSALEYVEKKENLDNRIVVETRIEQLQKFAQAEELNQFHRALIETAVMDLTEIITINEQEAQVWLTVCEEALNQGKDLQTLHKRLHAPPSFLPTIDSKKLSQLISEVDKTIKKEQKDTDIRKSLKNLQNVSSLKPLREQLGMVKSWAKKAYSTDLKHKLKAKENKLSCAIEKLEQILMDMRVRLDDATELYSGPHK